MYPRLIAAPLISGGEIEIAAGNLLSSALRPNRLPAHFYVAHHKGLATDPIKYFAVPENRDLGVVKSIRKPFKKLIIAPSQSE